jgi:hypothetical protein
MGPGWAFMAVGRGGIEEGCQPGSRLDYEPLRAVTIIHSTPDGISWPGAS